MKLHRHTPEQVVRMLREGRADTQRRQGLDRGAADLGDLRGDVEPLAVPVRRDEGVGGETAQGAGRGNSDPGALPQGRGPPARTVRDFRTTAVPGGRCAPVHPPVAAAGPP